VVLPVTAIPSYSRVYFHSNTLWTELDSPPGHQKIIEGIANKDQHQTG
jgi:hypothetical protein